MPRDNSGNYSLPQAPFVPGTVISSAAVNSDLADIATALTGSVAANGVTPITGQLVSSVTATPAFTGLIDKTSGFGVPSAGNATIFVNGVIVVDATATVLGVNTNAQISGNLTVSGNFTAGSIAFTGNGAVQLPAGTSAQRPAIPVAGDYRLNTTISAYEGYDGAEWQVASEINQRYRLVSSVAGGLLTVTVQNRYTGADPTTADPVQFGFPNQTGQLSYVSATSNLSISTNGIGASLGALNGVPFRLWVVLLNNSGTPVVGLINCSTASQIFPLREGTLQSSISISAAATSAGVIYSPNGVTVSNGSIKILGYLEYNAGLATAGTYNISPTLTTIYTQGTSRPGAIVQAAYGSSAGGSTTSGSPQTLANATLTPTSTINPILVQASGNFANFGASNVSVSTGVYRGGSIIGPGAHTVNSTNVNTTINADQAFNVLDTPNSVSSLTYALKYNSGNAVNSVSAGPNTIIVQELMG